MPINNIKTIVLVALFCLYCCRQTTLQNQILLFTMKQIESIALVKPSRESIFEGAMEGALNKLETDYGDPYSLYIPPKHEKMFHEQLDSKLEGIGVRFDPLSEKGEFRVFYSLYDSPAYNAGIKAGDTILKVEGVDIEGLTPNDLVKKIKGEPGTEVTLTVSHFNDETPVDMRIRRASIQQKTVFGFMLDDSGNYSVSIPDEDRTIGYIYIASFGVHTGKEVVALLQAFPPGTNKLVIDLRGNPGGYLKTAVEVADLFVDNKGPYREIVTTQNRNGQTKFGGSYYATSGVAFTGEILVLIDGGSASAAEIFAACLQDFERAKIMGQRSYGKGTVQEIFKLPLNSGTVKLTDASYWRPSGKNINRFKRPKTDDGSDEKKNPDESDDWGVSPDDGLEVEVSQKQRAITSFLRDLRINIPRDQTEPLYKHYLELLTKEISNIPKIVEAEDVVADEDETQKTDETFKPQGKPPYYDPVLDKAVAEMLKPKPRKQSNANKTQRQP